MQFHNWPKLTYSWAPAKRQLSPLSADTCAPLAVGSAAPGADWSRYNPPLLFFFFPLLLVGLIFSQLILLAQWLGGCWGWPKETVCAC